MMPAAALNPAESKNRCRTRILQSVLNCETKFPPLYPRTRARRCCCWLGLARRYCSWLHGGRRSRRSWFWARGADRLVVDLELVVLGQRKAQKFVHDVVLVVVRPFAQQRKVSSD